LYNIVKYCILFYPLQIKNKSREGAVIPAFILWPFSMVANHNFAYQDGTKVLKV
jgi:hypothetical protein